MSNEKVTQLPTVTAATAADIIYAVQSGTSVQETLQQVINLFSSSIVLNFSGNPNGNLAGVVYNLCWDTTHNLLWVCTTSGSTSTAVWKTFEGTPTNGQVLIGSTGNAPVLATLTAGTNISISNAAGTITIASTGTGGFSWTEVTGASQAMTSFNGYIVSNGSLVTLTLPTTSAVGDELAIVGKGAGGWSITYTTGQQIHIGSSASTLTTGHVASTNQYDSVYLVCTIANTTWTNLSAPQGNLTVA